jgi:hypothetical protein
VPHGSGSVGPESFTLLGSAQSNSYGLPFACIERTSTSSPDGRTTAGSLIGPAGTLHVGGGTYLRPGPLALNAMIVFVMAYAVLSVTKRPAKQLEEAAAGQPGA